jgi:hypothetical protein
MQEKLVGEWTGLIWLRMGPLVDTCERGNKLLASVKDGIFHKKLIAWSGTDIYNVCILTFDLFAIHSDLRI